MYDEVLNRKGFEQFLRDKGYTEEKIKEEWEKLKKHFEFSLYQTVYEMLPLGDKEKLVKDLDPDNKKDDLQPFLKRIEEFFKKNPEKLDRKKVLEKALQLAQSEYNQSLEKGGIL